MTLNFGKNRAASFIGIDIGGTNLRFALVHAEEGIVARHRVPTSTEAGWESLRESLYEGITLLMQEGRANGTPPLALGAGVPGLIGQDGQVYSSVNLLPLEGRNVRTCLAEISGLPVVAVNDANAIA